MITAIYHCSIKIISRGKGRSAVAAAAYRSGEKLVNDYDGVVHDFSKKGGVIYSEILLPDNAPREFIDRSVLWNAVETAEKSKNAQFSREVEIALPNEFSASDCIELAAKFAQKTFVNKGMCADVCIHDPDREQKNIHAHIMLTMRPFNEDGTWGDKQKKEYILDKDGSKIYDKRKHTYKCRTVQTTDWNNREKAEEWRAEWENFVNFALAEKGISEKADHRSFERQGRTEKPTVHMGVAATQMERKGIRTVKGDINREIKSVNAKISALLKRIETLDNALAKIKEIPKEDELADMLIRFHDNGIKFSEVRGVSVSNLKNIAKFKDITHLIAFVQGNKIRTLSELEKKSFHTKETIKIHKSELISKQNRIKELEELLDNYPLGKPPYGYRKSKTDKNVWEIDEEAAKVVRRIFQLCIDGYGPQQIAKKLTADKILIPTAYSSIKGYANVKAPKDTTFWCDSTVVHILERMEYSGHTVNFKTSKKSYKNKKKVDNPRSEWQIFENTHPAIISQHDFDLVQELRKNKRRLQKHQEVNPFSGIVCCADCGQKLYLCRSYSLTAEQEHMKCSTYAKRREDCSAHFIRTSVLEQLVLAELRKVTAYVREHEEEFVELAIQNSKQKQSAELKAAKKRLDRSEKRVSELNKLFARLYEDNISGKISDEIFEMMSKNYEAEQKELKQIIPELSRFIKDGERKNADTAQFIGIVRKYSDIPKLTPEIMHEFIEKIVVHAPDKSSGHRTQQIDICFRFNVLTATVKADRAVYGKKRNAA